MPCDTSGTIPAQSWIALGLLTCVSYFNYMDRVALAILIEPIKRDLQLSDSALGLLSGFAFAAFYAILGVPLGRLVDRRSRVGILAVCLMLWSAMTALGGFTRSFSQLFVTRMGVGVGEAGCLPASHSLIGDYFPPTRRALAISICQSGAVVGLSSGLMLVGYLEAHFGWRGALKAVGLAGLPIAIIVYLLLREPARRAPDTDVAAESFATAVRALLGRKALVHLLLAYALSAGVVTGVGQWEPAFLMRTYGLTAAQVGVWQGSASLLSGVLGLLAGGFLATFMIRLDSRWDLWIPALMFGISAPITAIGLMSPTPFMAIAIKNVSAFFASAGGGVALASVQAFAEPHRRGTAIAMMLFVSAVVGTGGGPLLVGFVSDLLAPSMGQQSLRYALLLVCLVLVWSIVHFLLAARWTPKDRVDLTSPHGFRS